jgi:hypothetical protein
MNFFIILMSFYSVISVGTGCDFYQALKVEQKYQIFSRGYKNGKVAQRFIDFAVYS